MNSTGATVANSLRYCVNGPGHVKQSNILDYLIGAVSHVDEIGAAPVAAVAAYKLPDKRLATHGVNSRY